MEFPENNQNKCVNFNNYFGGEQNRSFFVQPTTASAFSDSNSVKQVQTVMSRDLELGLGLRMNAAEILFPSTLLNYKPEFKTPAPPLHYASDEMHWMHPMRKNIHQLILNADHDGIHDEIQHPTEACQIYLQALEEPLPFALRQTILSYLEKEPDIVNYFGLTPITLPRLVTHNPNVAIPVLLILLERAGTDITDLLDALVDMDLSINTLEVVNRLANNLAPGSQAVGLPRPFLHIYISNCISQFDKIVDRYVQNRQARLVCVFLQSLLRNHIIEIQLIPQPLIFEIEAFCIRFSRIREATALYRDLKELESTENTMESAITKALEEMEQHPDHHEPTDANANDETEPNAGPSKTDENS